MKRILLLVLGYFLCVQAGLGALAGFGNPEKLALVWITAGIFIWIERKTHPEW